MFGDCLTPLPIPANPAFAGLSLWGQYLLFEPAGCMALGSSGSSAVHFVVQP